MEVIQIDLMKFSFIGIFAESEGHKGEMRDALGYICCICIANVSMTPNFFQFEFKTGAVVPKKNLRSIISTEEPK